MTLKVGQLPAVEGGLPVVSPGAVGVLRLMAVAWMTVVADGPSRRFMRCTVGIEVVPRKWFEQLEDAKLVERDDTGLSADAVSRGMQGWRRTERGRRLACGASGEDVGVRLERVRADRVVEVVGVVHKCVRVESHAAARAVERLTREDEGSGGEEGRQEDRDRAAGVGVRR